MIWTFGWLLQEPRPLFGNAWNVQPGRLQPSTARCVIHTPRTPPTQMTIQVGSQSSPACGVPASGTFSHQTFPSPLMPGIQLASCLRLKLTPLLAFFPTCVRSPPSSHFLLHECCDRRNESSKFLHFFFSTRLTPTYPMLVEIIMVTDNINGPLIIHSA